MKPTKLKDIAGWCGGTLDPQYNEVEVCGVATDSREVKPGQLFIPLVGARADGHTFIRRAVENGAAATLSSAENSPQGVPTIHVADTLLAFGSIAAGYRAEMTARVVAITGSVGKTTTKEMLAAIFQRQFRTVWTEGNHNNNLGLPMSVMDLEPDTEIAVLELGMNHFGEMSYLTKIARPDMAVFTNIGTMHIEHLGSREGILRAKLEILEGMPDDGVVVMNGDEPLLWNLRDSMRFKHYYFGVDNPACEVRASNVRSDDSGVTFEAVVFGRPVEIFVPANGQHTIYNALAAISAAALSGAAPENVKAGLAAFENTGMRQKIYERGGYTIIEDCYNAGPESMEAALNVLAERSTKGRRIAVLGDMLELGSCAMAEHYRIGRLAVGKADLIFAYGVDATRVVTGAVTGGMKPSCAMYYEDQDELIHDLRARTRPGDTLLFKGSRGMKMERALALFLNEPDEDDLPYENTTEETADE